MRAPLRLGPALALPPPPPPVAREEEQTKVREEEEKNWKQAMSGELSGPRRYVGVLTCMLGEGEATECVRMSVCVCVQGCPRGRRGSE